MWPSTPAGAARKAQIFVACLPFSGLIYAEATWTQRVEDWLSAHVRAFTAIGGVTAALVPDNLKRASPGRTSSIRCSTQLLRAGPSLWDGRPPARPRKPRKAGGGECAVQVNAGSWTRCATAPSSAGRVERRDRAVARGAQQPAAVAPTRGNARSG